MNSKILAAFAVVLLMGFVAPAFAEEDVSDAVDIAFWCGAAFTVAAQVEGTPTDQVESSNALAAILFAKAEVALKADGVDEAEYDRLTDYYVSDAFAQVVNETADTRYTAEECLDLAASE